MQANPTAVETFKTQVSCILGDLAAMMDMSTDPQGFGPCQVPAAASIIFTMEALGGLDNFMLNYIPEITQRDRQELVNTFRPLLLNALTPVRGLECYHSIRRNPGSATLIDRENGHAILNLSLLHTLFVLAIDRFITDVLGNDSSPAARFFAGLGENVDLDNPDELAMKGFS